MVNLPDPVSEMLGQPSGAPAGPAALSGGGRSVTPSAEPAQQAPSVGQTPQQSPAPTEAQGLVLPDLPVINNPEEVFETFYRQHGRQPSEPEVRAIRALPMLQRQLGRRPTKAELLSFLDSRNETRPAMPTQIV
ncbi:hypothetical protein LCGC14_1385220 [marine sediment metagenome]|uniref:Uncharacterized protein n=1 Tax=marine sediment metagenome TaxID=412755 RepID=A0A0F9K1S4_9ZZZZ